MFSIDDRYHEISSLLNQLTSILLLVSPSWSLEHMWFPQSWFCILKRVHFQYAWNSSIMFSKEQGQTGVRRGRQGKVIINLGFTYKVCRVPIKKQGCFIAAISADLCWWYEPHWDNWHISSIFDPYIDSIYGYMGSTWYCVFADWLVWPCIRGSRRSERDKNKVQCFHLV